MHVRKTKRKLTQAPVWLQPEAVQGSAVRYIASISPSLTRVEIIPEGSNKGLVIGESAALKQTTWDFEILSRTGKKLGTIRVSGEFQYQPSSTELEQINRVAKELGDQWPQG